MAANAAHSRLSELVDLIDICNQIIAVSPQFANLRKADPTQFQDFAIANGIYINPGNPPDVGTPQNVVQYTVGPTVSLLVTYIGLKVFDYSIPMGQPGATVNFQQVVCSDNDAGGHLDAQVFLTQKGINTPIVIPTAGYLAISNRPCIFLFPPGSTLNLLYTPVITNAAAWHLGTTPLMMIAGGLFGWTIKSGLGSLFQTIQTVVGNTTGYPEGTSGQTSSANETVPTNTPYGA